MQATCYEIPLSLMWRVRDKTMAGGPVERRDLWL